VTASLFNVNSGCVIATSCRQEEQRQHQTADSSRLSAQPWISPIAPSCPLSVFSCRAPTVPAGFCPTRSSGSIRQLTARGCRLSRGSRR